MNATDERREELCRGVFWRRLILAGIVFLGTFWVRFTEPIFHNDHYIWISGGRQILQYGQLPFRDFFDPGYFLQHFMSAGVQALFGDNLLGEALLSASLISVGTALTFWLSAAAGRSSFLGLLMAATLLALYPRLYNYPKLLLYPFGILLCWRYLARPAFGRLAALGAFTGFAFLVRHDHAVYIGVAAMTAIVASNWDCRRSHLFRQAAAYGAIAILPLAGFLPFIELNGGVSRYFATSSRFAATEPDRSGIGRLPTFQIDADMPSITLALPEAAAGRVQVRWAEAGPANQRALAEERHGLVDGVAVSRDHAGRTWAYTMISPTRDRIRLLLNDPLVEDTDGIDRGNGTLSYATPEQLYAEWQHRVPLLAIRIAPGILKRDNATVALYYSSLALPIAACLALLAVCRRGPARLIKRSQPERIAVVIALCAVATPILVRYPLAARLPDVAGPTLILLAWLTRLWWDVWRAPNDTIRPMSPHQAWLRSAIRVVPPATVCALVFLAAVAVGESADRIAQAATVGPPVAGLARWHELLSDLRSPPMATWTGAGDERPADLVRYVINCTEESDRTLVNWFAPEFYFFAKRGFAGGQIHVNDDRTAQRIGQESVPIVIVDASIWDEQGGYRGHVGRHLDAHYEVVAELTDWQGRHFRVLTDNRLSPTGVYEPLGLPCYRGHGPSQ